MIEITAVTAPAVEGDKSVDDMTRLETREALIYMFTALGFECSFGMGVSDRRPPFCVRGAPMVLKGAAAVAQTVDMRGSMLPEMGAGGAGTAAVVKTPCAMACCTGGTAASVVIAVASGTSAEAAGVSHSA